ncbi:MAG TPA: methionyl-tRNA formyltransferase [Candidatus Hydrogenedentes bacterium]|nr:methionyl-tRNA formyltransferase [Candidatus Hydrogenedentota bacterium]HOS01488.1 methionyl-tRNA formyltransferase [Candidatus Hydrogenedentota bacterium]
MRTVFFGTPELATPSLAAIARGHEVTAVVCQPDKPQGRSSKPVPPPVKAWAQDRGIAVMQPTRLNDGAFEAWLREQQPDICAIAAYGRLLKQPILDVPPHGFINMHPSLLPRHRGPSPITSALLEGDAVTGVSIMRLTLEVDSGDLLLQEATPIGPEENNIELTERLSHMGGELLLRAMDIIAAGQAVYTSQDHSRATYTRRLEKTDGAIDWSLPASRVHNLVRAAVPWPVAYTSFHGEICRIHAARPVRYPAEGHAPGAIVAIEKDAIVTATGDGCLAIVTLQMPGKKATSVSDFLRGHKVLPGDRFESPLPI